MQEKLFLDTFRLVHQEQTGIFESDNETGTGLKLTTQWSVYTKNCQ